MHLPPKLMIPVQLLKETGVKWRVSNNQPKETPKSGEKVFLKRTHREKMKINYCLDSNFSTQKNGVIYLGVKLNLVDSFELGIILYI